MQYNSHYMHLNQLIFKFFYKNLLVISVLNVGGYSATPCSKTNYPPWDVKDRFWEFQEEFYVLGTLTALFEQLRATIQLGRGARVNDFILDIIIRSLFEEKLNNWRASGVRPLSLGPLGIRRCQINMKSSQLQYETVVLVM